MPSRRFVSALALSLTAVGAVSVPTAGASAAPSAKDGTATCTVTVSSAATSSTTCNGGLAKKEYGVAFLANVDVSGVVVYQCQAANGSTSSGQPVRVESGSSTSFTPSKSSPTFSTVPAVLSAASATEGPRAGCPDGFTALDPRLTTTDVQLLVAATRGTIILDCTASDPNGLSGDASLGC